MLEARDRVGGRVLTRWLADGTQLDLGAQWVGPTQDRMYALLAGYGMGTFASAAYGPSTVLFPDGRHAGSARRPPAGPRPARRVRRAARPGRAVGGGAGCRWDRITLAGWLRTAAPDPATAGYLGRLLAGGLLAAGPDEISLLHMLFYLRSGGGIARCSRWPAARSKTASSAGAAGAGRGAGRRPRPGRRAAGCPGAGDRAGPRRRGPRTPTGPRPEADAVVVALPPTLAGRIRYDPPLPALRDALTQRMPMGSAFKVHAVYPELFWRADGRSGVAVCLAGPVTETVDNGTPDSARGVLTAFSYGPEARALRRMSPGARRAALLDASPPSSVRRPAAGRVRRVRLVGRRVDAGLLLRGADPGLLVRVRAGAASAGGAGALGRYGDRHPVGRLPGRGDEAGERAAAEILAGAGR